MNETQKAYLHGGTKLLACEVCGRLVEVKSTKTTVRCRRCREALATTP
jgi:anaerobic ribonucleoside-triphosphate reductase